MLAISTTASAQFVVPEHGKEFHFFSALTYMPYPQLEVGDVIYADELNLCLDDKNQLSLKTDKALALYESSSALYKITLVSKDRVAIEHALEQNGFMLDGPAMKIVNKLKTEDLRDSLCNWDSNINEPNRIVIPGTKYKVESLFGFVDYEGLANGIIKDLTSKYKKTYGPFRYDVRMEINDVTPLEPLEYTSEGNTLDQ